MKSQTPSCFEKYKDSTVIVLGSTGFIGRWVARTLYQSGANLYLPVRNKASAKQVFNRFDIDGNIIEINLDKTEKFFLKLYRDIKPAITFNLAGYGVDRSQRNKTDAYHINSDLVNTICNSILEGHDNSWGGQNIIHAGSVLEYGDISGDLSENTVPNPTTLYGLSKLSGTRNLTHHCKTNGIRGITARLFSIYGPGEIPDRLLPSLISAAREKKQLNLTKGLQKRDFTYLGDVSEGLLRLGVVNKPCDPIINLATGKLMAVREFIEKAATLLSISPEMLQFGSIPTRTEEMEHNPVSTERLLKTINWIPETSAEDGIKRTIAFLNSHNRQAPV